jgi:hypothetical protein
MIVIISSADGGAMAYKSMSGLEMISVPDSNVRGPQTLSVPLDTTALNVLPSDNPSASHIRFGIENRPWVAVCTVTGNVTFQMVARFMLSLHPKHPRPPSRIEIRKSSAPKVAEYSAAAQHQQSRLVARSLRHPQNRHRKRHAQLRINADQV